MKQRKIAVIGLGYVGLALAVAFGKKHHVLGFDINTRRLDALSSGVDYTKEFSREEINNSKIEYTNNPARIKDCNFIIITVPTPIDEAKKPDLTALISASRIVGENLKQDSIVVYESTVYPGATEEVCIPVLEKHSGFKENKEFYVGYSPERINPGDKEHTVENIIKVISANNENILNIIATVYGEIIQAGVYKTTSIKVAEAAKVIENTQRDLNIALINEFAVIFNKMGIDTMEILKAASTKWNFLPFTPGLVGGHCIGVDPYYLTYKSELLGYCPQVILAGRRINDNMGKYVATSLIKKMILKGINIQESVVTVLGITFKENVSDFRNTRVIDIVNELKEYGVRVQVTDALADYSDAFNEYNEELIPLDKLNKSDAVVLAVPHKEYIEGGWKLLKSILKNGQGVVADIKSVLDKEMCPENICLWRL